MRYPRKTTITICTEATTMIIPDKVWDLTGEIIIDILEHAMSELNKDPKDPE